MPVWVYSNTEYRASTRTVIDTLASKLIAKLRSRKSHLHRRRRDGFDGVIMCLRLRLERHRTFHSTGAQKQISSMRPSSMRPSSGGVANLTFRVPPGGASHWMPIFRKS